MPRLTKVQETIAAQFGFSVEEPPELERTRSGKNDEKWQAAIEFCKQFPGKSVKVSRYNTKAAAATDSRNINNGGAGVGRFFRGNLNSNQWLSVIRPVVNEDGEPVMAGKTNRSGQHTQCYDLYLKYQGE